MKLFIILLFSYFLTTGAIAQDIIVKNDKTEIKAKIEEITETTIKYKKFEMLDGPIYNINVNDVFMIMYKNGAKEYIQAKTNTQAPVQNNTPVVNPSVQNAPTYNSNQTTNIGGAHEPMVRIRRGYYSFEGEKLKAHSDYVTTFNKYGYTDLGARYKEGRNITYVGAGVGLGMVVGYAISSKVVFMYIGGSTALIASIIGTSMRDSAVKKFNTRATKKIGFNKIELSPTFNIDGHGNHIGISIGF
jgi:hypothetical protein